MKALLLTVTIACLCAFGAGQSSPRKKAFALRLVDTKVRRQDGNITVDGRVRITGEKSIRGLVVIFDFLAAEGGVIASEKTAIEQPVMAPGQEASYHAETPDLARAVQCVVRAMDRGNRDLTVAGAGPFAIE